MREQIKDFLVKLNSIFPLECKRIEPVFETYTDIILGRCLNKEYDFKKLLSLIAQNYKYTTFPNARFILEQLPYAEIVHYEAPVANKDFLIVLKLPKGVVYCFTVADTGRSVKELKADYMKKYGDCEIKMYPKGTLLVGNEIIEP